MTARAVLSLLLCVAALAVGLYTAWLSSRNRQRAAELDLLQRWCETYARQNEELRVRNLEEEWRLMSSAGALLGAEVER